MIGLLLAVLLPLAASALPVTPASDDEVVERLPAWLFGPSSGQAQTPRDPRDPAAVAEVLRQTRLLLNAAHREGDPRAAGSALALLAPWRDDLTAPAAVVIMRATLEQFLHEFDTARARLEALVARDPRQPQAWLTLATLYRLRADYPRADQACRQVAATGVWLYGGACLLENRALRGEVEPARRGLQALLSAAPDAATRSWLLTTLAELEQRDGRMPEAAQAFARALADEDNAYVAVAYADLLIAAGKPSQALEVLRSQAPSDAVLLRQVIAGRQVNSATLATDTQTLATRFAQTSWRPGASVPHARELAMYALDVRGDAASALKWAALNLREQREPLDMLLYARSARAAGDKPALAVVARMKRDVSLWDRRLDALL